LVLDLNPVEEAEALKKLMDDHSYQQDDPARIIGKSPATISVSFTNQFRHLFF
jgi:ParB-like chromosome segregation protein Spo0J